MGWGGAWGSSLGVFNSVVMVFVPKLGGVNVNVHSIFLLSTIRVIDTLLDLCLTMKTFRECTAQRTCQHFATQTEM